MKQLAIMISAALATTALAGTEIVCPANAPSAVKLAAKEVRRYVYLRTGELLKNRTDGENGTDKTHVTITLAIDPSLGAQQYRLKSTGKDLTISGGSDVAVLYGAYAFAEKLGVRFYLHGDVVPDAKIPLALPLLDETRKPLFETRGIQPFHDFYEGPDWWNADDYKACLSQMAKMKMNFIGFHCYPRLGLPWDGQEPLVWTGVADDFVPQSGKVKFSYPTAWANTQRRTWGAEPGKTDDFAFGASQLFADSVHGAEVMRGLTPMPGSPAQSNEMFNRAGDLMKDAFTYGHRLGIKAWVGLELPLWIPNELRDRLKSQGKNPDDLAVRTEIFDGMFRRVKAAYPADGFWFWTGERPDAAATVKEELLAAYGAMAKLPSPLPMGQAGWGDLANHFGSLNTSLPKDMTLACINPWLGFAPVPPQFAGLGDRPRFAIPWLEDDTNMTAPQLFVGRIRMDATDARRYGCSGLLGIHWRTRTIAPNLAALSQCGWQEIVVNNASDITGTEGQINHFVTFKNRSLPADDFYRDWCTAEFGPDAGSATAAIFTRMDGHLPRPSCWCLDGAHSYPAGPGLVGDADPRPWAEAQKEYAFVDEFSALRTQRSGAGYLDRFDYWAGQFQYLKAMAKVRCSRGVLDRAVNLLAKAAPAGRDAALADALSARQQLVADWGAMMTRLLEIVSSTGEMGTVANLELHSRKSAHKLELHDATLGKALGKPLPPIPLAYAGKPRLIVPTVRSAVAKGESLTVKIIALDKQPVKSVTILIRPLGRGDWQSLPATHVARAVYQAVLPAATEDFEYFITAESDTQPLPSNNQNCLPPCQSGLCPVSQSSLPLTPRSKSKIPLIWPVTAPEMNQTVVVTE